MFTHRSNYDKEVGRKNEGKERMTMTHEDRLWVK